MKTTPQFQPLAIIILAILASACHIYAKPIPPNTTITTIYLDTQHSEEGGINLISSSSNSTVVDWLTAHGYEVIESENQISDKGRLVLTYSIEWDIINTSAYIKIVTTKLRANGRTLGSITVEQPAKEGSVRKLSNLYGVIADCLSELFKECHPTPKDLAVDPKRDRTPPHPSSMLKPMTNAEVGNLTTTLASIKYPISMKELIEQLGGKPRVYQLLDEIKKIDEKRVFMARFALSDIQSPTGYIFIDLYSNSVPPEGTKYDDVIINGAYLIYHTPFGMNFIPAPRQIHTLKEDPK